GSPRGKSGGEVPVRVSGRLGQVARLVDVAAAPPVDVDFRQEDDVRVDVPQHARDAVEVLRAVDAQAPVNVVGGNADDAVIGGRDGDFGAACRQGLDGRAVPDADAEQQRRARGSREN